MRTAELPSTAEGSIPRAARARRGRSTLAAVLGAAALALAILFTAGCQSAAPDADADSYVDPGPDPDPGITVAQTYSVFHWNVAGSAIHRGRTDTGLVQDAIASITAAQPDFISFNEICQDQYEAIRDGLAEVSGWTVPDAHARFAVTRDPGTGICRSGGFGNALLSSHELGTSEEYLLPKDYTKGEKARLSAAGRGVEDRKMLCAPPADQPRMKFCTVHITGSNRALPAPRGGSQRKVNSQQLAEVARILDSFAKAKQAYLVAGDFNAQPDLKQYVRLKPLMKRHTELDDNNAAHCPGYGTWTALPPREAAGQPACGPHPKIDLIIARGKLPAGAYSAQAQNIPADCKAVGPDNQIVLPVSRVYCSDHRALTGRATIQVPTG
ncbi:endonuclease/exonuclease/phosphatase family protein [Streptomyces sp. NBC_00096]|uniref:endonuclease/exonuclease/phosphatase family protein n=1 Tax=Streptomyces sp. NBC_00096 TaxID=2975650 RepID=UPI003255EA94